MTRWKMLGKKHVYTERLDSVCELKPERKCLHWPIRFLPAVSNSLFFSNRKKN